MAGGRLPAAEARCVRLTARERPEAIHQGLRSQGRAARRGRCSERAPARTTVAGGSAGTSNETAIRGSGVRVRGGRQSRRAAKRMVRTQVRQAVRGSGSSRWLFASR